MTRRPLQQLPFLRRVLRECSPVGQYISIGPSEKERRNYYACGRGASAFRARKTRSPARSLAMLSYGKTEQESRTRMIVSSLLLRRPRPRSVNNRSTGESYHAACLVSSWQSGVPICTWAIGPRASSSKFYFYPLSAIHRRHSLPPRGYPFRRADRPFVFLLLATRRVTAFTSLFIGCSSSYEVLRRST